MRFSEENRRSLPNNKSDRECFRVFYTFLYVRRPCSIHDAAALPNNTNKKKSFSYDPFKETKKKRNLCWGIFELIISMEDQTPVAVE
ncbi:hypothetical protein HZS_929 [Henneguya salminicola]|nr:hypothetical protein HZS_929 [Henneguya salminicola]